MKALIYITIAIFTLSFGAPAQVTDRPIEIGGFLSTIDLQEANGEKPLGVGARFAYNINNHVAIDSEISHFPKDGQNNFGQTMGLVGVKAGARTKHFGIFGKVRPGFVHFGGEAYRVFGNDSPTKPVVDVGGVVEIYPSRRSIIRVDVGDTIIPFGDDRFPSSTPLVIRQPGTTHTLQTSVGFGFRF